MVKYELVEKLLYQGEEGAVEGSFVIGEDTLWASRSIVAQIFGTDKTNISKHFRNIVQDGELIEKEVSLTAKELFGDDLEFSEKYSQNLQKGGRPQIWYNLDAIISIGYRINSKRATHFRKWSNKIIKEYMVKGYVLNTEVLKNGGVLGKDYFDQLLEEIREIR